MKTIEVNPSLLDVLMTYASNEPLSAMIGLTILAAAIAKVVK